jgi:hypothetical protein
MRVKNQRNLTVSATELLSDPHSGPRKIFKFGLDVNDWQAIEMPVGAILLDVQAQGGVPQLWAIVDPSPYAKRENRLFRTIGTGDAFDYDPAMIYRGSYQMHGGALVFHLFESTNRRSV